MNTSKGIQDNILFLENRSDINRIYQAMDVFVLPSRYEGLPVVGVEAQAEGLPCILSDKMTKETKIAENTVFMNLGEGPYNWAKAVIDAKKKRNIQNDVKEFDITTQAGNLARYYDSSLTSLNKG